MTAHSPIGTPLVGSSDFFGRHYGSLRFATEPPGTVSASGFFSPETTVYVLDPAGNIDFTFNGIVTLTSDAGAPSVSVITAKAGVATFSGLRLSGTGSHKLTFAAPGRVPIEAALTVSQEPSP